MHAILFPCVGARVEGRVKTLGLAMEIRIDRQRHELGAMEPMRYGLKSPSITNPGQNARVRLVLTVKSLLANFHVIVASPAVNEGRIQGRGRQSSTAFSGVLRRRAWSHGAWSGGVPLPRYRNPDGVVRWAWGSSQRNFKGRIWPPP